MSAKTQTYRFAYKIGRVEKEGGGWHEVPVPGFDGHIVFARTYTAIGCREDLTGWSFRLTRRKDVSLCKVCQQAFKRLLASESTIVGEWK